MAVTGPILAYVAREVISGDVFTSVTKFDAKLKENIQSEEKVKNPVVVFFPNQSCQVMSMKAAEKKGFLKQPEILNFTDASDQVSAAGRYRNALREDARLQGWNDLENDIISACVSASGHPLPLDCRYSDNSIYYAATAKGE